MKVMLEKFPWGDLLRWHEKSGRHDLPWREYGENSPELIYRVWISEIFLQQTQVSRVIDYFKKVIERFPTIRDLAHADYETFFPYYQGLGYYSRARNILKAAKIIEETYEGIWPRDLETLSKLPGVGPYTTRAILAFGYGDPYLAWDTNLEKVFARYYHGRKDEKLSREEKEIIEEDFHLFCIRHCEEGVCSIEEGRGNPRTWKKEHWIASYLAMTKQQKVRSINNALMDFASIIDLKNPANIDWETYPIKNGEFYKSRGSLEPQEMKKSESFPIPDASVVVILHKDHKVYYSNDEVGAIKYQELSDSKDQLGPTIGYLISHASYLPFILPPSLTRDTRKYVQDSFREKYGLELSVRPVHKKWLSHDGKPYIAVNAQVQVGDVGQFREWRKP